MTKANKGAKNASGVTVGKGVGVGGEGGGSMVIRAPMAILTTTKMLRIKKMI